VVDETSMVDVPPMRAVLRALPELAALLLVGDVAGGKAPRRRSP
jgi:exodeoxyribonuclease V alpha subunit